MAFNMIKSFKYRLYPKRRQSEQLASVLEVCRNLYNDSIAERSEAWKYDGFNVNKFDQMADIPEKRKMDERMESAHSHVLQDVVKRVDKAFSAFFRRCKSGGKAGYPRFKSYGRYDSMTCPDANKYVTKCGRLKWFGLGEIDMKLHRPIEGRIKTCTIKRKGSKWYVIFLCDNVEPKVMLPCEKSVGIDVGLTDFATLSDGTIIPNHRFGRKSHKQIDTAQRAVSRKVKGSNRRRKAVSRLKDAHARLSNKRRDFHHKTARKIVNEFGRIAVEKLNIRNMVKNRYLARSISDAGWSQFLLILHAKAEEAGREFMAVNPNGTSQTCTCGGSVPKTLSDRWHECVCGESCGRDVMSARVILQRASFA